MACRQTEITMSRAVASQELRLIHGVADVTAAVYFTLVISLQKRIIVWSSRSVRGRKTWWGSNGYPC